MTETTTHIESISVRFLNLGVPLLVILILGAVAFSIWYYHTAVPQPSGFMKRLLITIRALALIFLITGLAEPVVKAVKTVTRKSYCAVLIDTSSSMDQPDDPGRKAEALEALRTLQSSPGEHCLYRSLTAVSMTSILLKLLSKERRPISTAPSKTFSRMRMFLQ